MKGKTILFFSSIGCLANYRGMRMVGAAAVADDGVSRMQSTSIEECDNNNHDKYCPIGRHDQYHNIDHEDNSITEKILEELVWEKGTWADMHDWLDCADITDRSQYTIQDTPFKFYRTSYQNFIKEDQSGLQSKATEFPPENNNNSDNSNEVDENDDDENYETTIIAEDGGDFKVRVKAKYTKDIGRGIFADEFIPRGALVWESLYVAEFQHVSLYRRYLRQLPTPQMACEILHFSYSSSRSLNATTKSTLNDANDNSSSNNNMDQSLYSVCVDLSPSSFVNMCIDSSECNIDFLEGNEGKVEDCKFELYASKDIGKGQELLMPYNVMDDNFEYVGLRGPSCFEGEGYEQKQQCDNEKDDHDGGLNVEDEAAIEELVWNKGTLEDMYEWLECRQNTDRFRYFDHNWTSYREKYLKFMEDSSLEFQQVRPINFPDGIMDFKVPIVSNFSEETGRGIYADDFISKGKMILKPSFVAEFHESRLFRGFIQSLPETMACEALSVAFVGILNPHDKESYFICVELSSSAFTRQCLERSDCNADYHFKNGGERIIQDCRQDLYATRDIMKEEEILIPNGDETAEEGLEFLGLLGPSCCFDDGFDDEEEEDYREDYDYE